MNDRDYDTQTMNYLACFLDPIHDFPTQVLTCDTARKLHSPAHHLTVLPPSTRPPACCICSPSCFIYHCAIHGFYPSFAF